MKNIFLTETKSEFKNRLVYDYFKYVLKPNWINIWNGLINNLINLIDAAMMPEKEIEELIKQELKIIDPETGICSFDDTKITLLDALSSKLFSCIFDMVRDAMNIDVDVRLFNFTHKHVQDKQLTDQIDKWVNDFKNKYWKFVDLSKHSLNNDVIYKRQLWVEPKKAKYTEKSFVECWPEIKEFMREYFSPTGKIIVEIENYIKKLVKETPNILNQKSYSEYLWNYK